MKIWLRNSLNILGSEGNVKIKVPKSSKIVVVGDIHEHEEQVNKLFDEIIPSENLFLVFVGDFYHKGFGINVANSIISRVKASADEGNTFAIKGNHELKEIRQSKRNGRMTDLLRWVNKCPLSLCFEFSNRTLLTVVHGGVRPGHTWDDLDTNVETAYIRQLDSNGDFIKYERVVIDGCVEMKPVKPGGIIWHEMYDGRFGYIASGHNAQKDGVAKFYNYSCNLDTAVYHTGKLTAQVFSEKGKEEMFTFTGPAKYPDLYEMKKLMALGQI